MEENATGWSWGNRPANRRFGKGKKTALWKKRGDRVSPLSSMRGEDVHRPMGLLSQLKKVEYMQGSWVFEETIAQRSSNSRKQERQRE